MGCFGASAPKNASPVTKSRAQSVVEPMPVIDRRPGSILVTEEAVVDACNSLESLEAVLSDNFAASYLLSMTQAEFSSENIVFLLAVRTFEQHAASESEQSLELAKSIVKTHVKLGSPMEVNSTAKQRKVIDNFMASWVKGEPPGPPRIVFQDLYRVSYRTSAFDVFPRFKLSPHCKELVKLHMSRTMQQPRCLERFKAFSTDEEVTVLEFWLAAQNFDNEYECLASGWPSDDSCRNARLVFSNHAKALAQLLAEPAIAQLKRQVLEAPPSLYRAAQILALNFLHEKYEQWLESPEGKAYCEELAIDRLKKPTTDTDMFDGGDYNAGW